MSEERPSHQTVIDATEELASEMRPQRVPINAYETPAAFVVVAPLPAVTSDDVTIDLTDGTLRFWAELRSAGPRDFVIHEWEYGGYERELELPQGYGGGLEATLTNGQLVIRVLKGGEGTTVRIKPSS
jgi:HSP20 family molecular chaperone IbpA